jgi:hypothetical protein
MKNSLPSVLSDQLAGLMGRGHGLITRSALLGALGSFILLTGCATDDGIPPDQVYQAPSLGAAGVAHITGTKVVESGLFADNHVGYVLMVDDKFVPNALDEWNQPIALSPGWHEIAAAYQSGVFSSRTTFRFKAAAGSPYLLKIAAGLESDGDHRYCNFSIVDGTTGTPVTAIKHCNVSGGDNPGRSLFRAVD